MHIGMIGGIGPASTVAYYQSLSAAVRDAGGVLDLTIVNADVNELIRNNDADDKNAQAKAYGKFATFFDKQGALIVVTMAGKRHLDIGFANVVQSVFWRDRFGL